MSFKFKLTEIPEVILITPKVFKDERGYFMETYKESDFFRSGIREKFVQDNRSKSVKGTIRGLHYQISPFAQGKLVQCITGEIFDVAVDIRKNSTTFTKWVGVYLSEENRGILYVPVGFAHGFYTVSEIAEVVYKATSEYSSKHDKGIIWNDPDVHIKWPSHNIILSEKDKRLPRLKNAELFL